MAYRNTTQGARAIHLTNGGYQLVEAGAVLDIDPAKVRRLAPGLEFTKDSDVPEVPADVAKKAKAAAKPKKAPADDVPTLRAAYKKATGKNAFNGWNAATLKDKIAAAGK